MAVSADADADAKALHEKLALSFPIVSDADLAVTKAYGVVEDGKEHPRPASFVLDANRKVLFAHDGRNPADRPTIQDLLDAGK